MEQHGARARGIGIVISRHGDAHWAQHGAPRYVRRSSRALNRTALLFTERGWKISVPGPRRGTAPSPRRSLGARGYRARRTDVCTVQSLDTPRVVGQGRRRTAMWVLELERFGTSETNATVTMGQQT